MSLNEDNRIDPDVLALRQDLRRGYTIWSIDEIYLGGAVPSKGLSVPNVGDKVDSYEGNTLIEQRVVAVDESTLIPTLEAISRPVEVDEESLNQFSGVGPGYQSETWRVFYDESVTPHTLMVDSNLHKYGTEVSYCKLFKGTDISRQGNVVSQWRDNSANPYSENVPMYVVSTRHDASEAIKRPPVFYTTEFLEVGEYCTLVTYNDNGTQCSEDRLIVASGANIRKLADDQKYVTGIEIVSPFLSESDDRLLLFPSNMPLDGVFTRARVAYSDGSEQYLTIDGGRMAILGLDYYVATRANETNRMALRYTLAPNEHAWNTSTGENRHITEIYHYRTMPVDGSYAVMINLVPEWNEDRKLWEPKYWLYNLDRTIGMDVTEYIRIGHNSDVFNGRKFGVTQHLTLVLQLEDLNIGLNQYRFVQQIDVGLVSSPDVGSRPYLINYSNNQAIAYGEYNIVKYQNGLQVGDLTVNLNTQIGANGLDDWLEKTYYAAEPLYDAKIELRAPEPTHFVVMTPDLSYEQEYPIEYYNQNLPFNRHEHPFIKTGGQLNIEFIRKQGNTTQHMCMTSWHLRAV